MNVSVASRAAERIKTFYLRKLGNFKKIPEKFRIDENDKKICCQTF